MLKCKYGLGIGLFLGVVLIGCFALPGAWAQGPEGEALVCQEVGKIERTQGAAMVRRAGEADFGLISRGDPVYCQDTIGTDPTDKKRQNLVEAPLAGANGCVPRPRFSAWFHCL